MGVTQVEKERPKGNWRAYLFSSLGFLCTVLLLAAAIYFREEIRHAGGYGYIGVFAVGVLGGISIIPAPTLVMVFFLGGMLNPAYVGLTASFGGAIGGITVYLTGAGVESVWSRLRSKEQDYENEPGRRYDIVRPVESQFWSKGEAVYNRLVKWMGGKGGYWTLFITSAMIISPFYFAGLAAGSLRMGLLKFFLISWTGKAVRYLIVAYAGYLGLDVLLQWIGG
ncbi:VTT domain-containing protein [Chloroflexota bacterium]